MTIKNIKGCAKLDKKNIKRILIIRLGKIGDVLLTTPLVRNLRKKFPRASITYIVGRNAAPILENNLHINDLVVADKNVFFEIIKRKRYDLAIDLNAIDITAQLCVVCGAKYRVGIYAGAWVRKNYNRVLSNPKKDSIVVDYFLSLLNLLGLENDKDRTTEIYLTGKERKAAQNSLKCFHKKIIGIQPAGDIRGRLWSARKFAQLADILIQEYSSEVLIFQAQKEEKIARRMKNYMKQRATLLPVFKLRGYLSILSECNLFIGNEGGQLHMAKAFNVPAVGIFQYSPVLNYWFYYKDKFTKIVSENIEDISAEQVILGIKSDKLIR